MSYTLNETHQHITLQADELELAWSREDGRLCVLRFADGPNLIGFGPAQATVDVAYSGHEEWRANRSFVRYLSHQAAERDGGVELTVSIGIGPLKLYDHYRITGGLVARRIRIENVGLDEQQIRGVRLVVPYACVGEATTCRFEAPGNSVRPRVPLEVAAEQRRDVLPRRFFAPGLRDQRAIESAPTQGPGLLALHAGERDETLLCWYYSDVEPALPFVQGSHDIASDNTQPAVSLGHEIKLEGWLGAGASLLGGTQYLMLLRQPWPEALQAFQNTWPLCGLQPLEQVAPWVRDAAIYELHPSAYGGFAGLAAALPGLHALGFNTLYLMPIWEFDNRKGRQWDGNWSTSGSIYAICDFEQLDSTLGTPEELRALVDTAHSLGMRVLLDLVTQGCAREARYVQEAPGWFCRDEEGELVSSRNWNDTYSFDWNNQQFQDYMLWWALEQVRRYDIDGYRVHAPFDKEPNWSRQIPYHASATSLGVLRLLDRLQDELKRLKPDAALLCELYGPIYIRNHDFCYDYLAHHMFFHLALNRLTPSELGEWLNEHWRALPTPSVRVCFTETHNTRTLNPLADGMRGSRISRLLLAGMVLCGFVPMLWNGQEQGDEAFVQALLHARADTPALRYGAARFNAVPCDYRQVFVVLREHEGQHLLGLLNVGPHKRTVSLSLPIDTLQLDAGRYQLRELLSGQVWVEEQRSTWDRDELLSLCLTLEAYGAYCFCIEQAPYEEPAPAAEPAAEESVEVTA
jgi:glycosidase